MTNNCGEIIEIITPVRGKSAYEIWLELGNTGSEQDFIDALSAGGTAGNDGNHGADGKSAYQIWQESDPANADKTIEDFLESLRGAAGVNGVGTPGTPGDDGKSAYQLWQESDPSHADGTIDDFIASLMGAPGAQGIPGTSTDGQKGDTGKSAYQIWQESDPANADKTESEFLIALIGARGEKGDPGDAGADGIGTKGDTGDSAYDIWRANGNSGTMLDFLASLRGAAGADGVGIKGDTGSDGADGKSAYQIWQEAGNTGTVQMFLASLVGDAGQDGVMGLPGIDGEDGIGKSAYQVWLDLGNTGDEQAFIDSLKGATGTIEDTDSNPIVKFSDNAETVGAHAEYGGGVRWETFPLVLTGAEISNGAKTIPVPGGRNVVFQSWTAEVLTANTAGANIRITPGGSSIEANAQDLELSTEGAAIESVWGIPRNLHGSVITLSNVTDADIDETTVLLLAMTVSQAVPLGEFPPEVVTRGAKGASAYQVWLDEGNEGTAQDFLDSLKGDSADETLSSDAIESLITGRLNGSLITAEGGVHDDILAPEESYSGIIGAPTNISMPFTITDPAADRFEKVRITFYWSAGVISDGGNDPIITGNIYQRGQLVENAVFHGIDNNIMVAFDGYANEEILPDLDITWNTDEPLVFLRPRIFAIAWARTGALHEAIGAYIHEETDSSINALNAAVAALRESLGLIRTELTSTTIQSQNNALLLASDGLQLMSQLTLVDETKSTDTPSAANGELGDGGKNFAARFNAENGNDDNSNKFFGVLTSGNPTFTYNGRPLVSVAGSRIVGEVYHAAVPRQARDIQRYPSQTVGNENAAADIVHNLGTDGDVVLDTNLPRPNTSTGVVPNLVIYAQIYEQGNPQGVVNINAPWATFGSRNVVAPDSSTATVTLVARRDANGHLVLEWSAANRSPVLSNAEIHIRAVWTELDVETAAAIAERFANTDLGAFTGDAVFGIDLGDFDSASDTTIKLYSGEKSLNTNWDVDTDERGSILTDNPGMTFFVIDPGSTLTAAKFARIQRFVDQSLPDAGLFGIVESHSRVAALPSRLTVLDDEGGVHDLGKLAQMFNLIHDMENGAFKKDGVAIYENSSVSDLGGIPTSVFAIPAGAYITGFAVSLPAGSNSPEYKFALYSSPSGSSLESASFFFDNGKYKAALSIDHNPATAGEGTDQLEFTGVGGASFTYIPIGTVFAAYYEQLCPPD